MSPLNLVDLHTRLVTLLATDEAASTVEALLGGAASLDDVASRSYAHPNGFRKLVIALAEDGTKLRLHHWPQGDVETSNAHNHRWAFASAIVAGRVRSALLAIGEKGETVERYRFEPSHPGGRYTLSPAGTGALSTTSVAEFGPGSTYALSAEQLHRVRADPNTLSLVLSGPAERATPTSSAQQPSAHNREICRSCHRRRPESHLSSSPSSSGPGRRERGRSGRQD